jgi:hypothetical protein
MIIFGASFAITMIVIYYTARGKIAMSFPPTPAKTGKAAGEIRRLLRLSKNF